MALKRAEYLTYGYDELCVEMRKFIENAGILLDVRDIAEKPLSEEELTRLIGHLQIMDPLVPVGAHFFGEARLFTRWTLFNDPFHRSAPA